MKCPLPAILAFCLAAAVSNAAPLKGADIPTDPLRLLHIDCDALRETYIGKYLLFQLDKPEMHSNIVAFRSLFSFDLRTQLHGMTLYSVGTSPRENVVITYADFDPDRFAALLMGLEAVEVATNDHHVIYSWRDKRKNPDDPPSERKYGAIQKGCIVVSQSEKSLIAALCVMDHPPPNPPEQKNPLNLINLKNDPLVVVAMARNLDFLGTDPVSSLIKMARRFSLQASEADEKLNGILTMEAGDEHTASQVAVAAQGLVALLGLQKENPRAAKLAGGIAIKQDHTNVTAGFSLSSRDIIAAWKAHTAKKEPANADK